MHSPASRSFTDPVCGMQVTPDSAAGSAEFRGTTSYFCSTHCQRKFEADPAAFVHSEEHGSAEQAESCCGPSAKEEDAPAHSATPAPASRPHHEHHSHSAAETANAAAERKPAKKYFCPMCPGVESDKPGDCPKCGMALERNPAWKPRGEDDLHLPDAPGDRAGPSGRLPEVRHGAGAEDRHGRTRRGECRTARHDAAVLDRRGADAAGVCRWRWRTCSRRRPQWVDERRVALDSIRAQTPVVLWAGWPFFVRGWRSLVNRHLNMFTLIAIGVGAAYALQRGGDARARASSRRRCSTTARSAIYFEAAAVIIVLVLLGQVLELRARSRTGSAIKRCSISRRRPRASCANGDEREVPLDQVQRGDQLRVRPGEKVPVDGERPRRPHERR